jgi:hypothetical protein
MPGEVTTTGQAKPSSRCVHFATLRNDNFVFKVAAYTTQV